MGTDPLDPESNNKKNIIDYIKIFISVVYDILKSDRFSLYDLGIAAAAFLILILTGHDMAKDMGSIYFLVFISIAFSALGMFFGIGLFNSIGRIMMRIMFYSFISIICYINLSHLYKMNKILRENS